jgi:hypothetical protein
MRIESKNIGFGLAYIGVASPLLNKAMMLAYASSSAFVKAEFFA